MVVRADSALEAQLQDRRRRLQTAVGEQGETDQLVRLLREVDTALDRIHEGHYGVCDVCHEDIEQKDLRAYPLMRYCLCKLSPAQLDELSQDLDLAWRIQTALLPSETLRLGGWEAHYRYEPVGPVSGDYCDLLRRSDDAEEFFFVVGDVSGKGIAASLLMAHLNALFRSLLDLGLPTPELVARANRLLLESTIPSHYATLVCGWARRGGTIELCNAGHCEPIVVRRERIETLGSTGTPVGLLENKAYTLITTRLEPGDALVLYTDGLIEARNGRGESYDLQRLSAFLQAAHRPRSVRLADACLKDLSTFLEGSPRSDDLTLLVLQQAG